jgi:hypothetical protein
MRQRSRITPELLAQVGNEWGRQKLLVELGSEVNLPVGRPDGNQMMNHAAL